MNLNDAIRLEETLKPEQRIARGARIAALMEEDVVKGLFTRLDAQVTTTFKQATTDDARRDVWALMNALEDLKRCLQAAIDDGELAKREKFERAKSGHPKGTE